MAFFNKVVINAGHLIEIYIIWCRFDCQPLLYLSLLIPLYNGLNWFVGQCGSLWLSALLWALTFTCNRTFGSMPVIKTQVAIYGVCFYGNYSCHVPPDGLFLIFPLQKFCSPIIPSQITGLERPPFESLSFLTNVRKKPCTFIFQFFVFVKQCPTSSYNSEEYTTVNV